MAEMAIERMDEIVDTINLMIRRILKDSMTSNVEIHDLANNEGTKFEVFNEDDKDDDDQAHMANTSHQIIGPNTQVIKQTNPSKNERQEPKDEHSKKECAYVDKSDEAINSLISSIDESKVYEDFKYTLKGNVIVKVPHRKQYAEEDIGHAGVSHTQTPQKPRLVVPGVHAHNTSNCPPIDGRKRKTLIATYVYIDALTKPPPYNYTPPSFDLHLSQDQN
ncbi:unnamed protein product [Citrullus colocynthis]|uniref:Uncharacterized protein n=1 Tax=Citrullus colocynthis TaxID=252529 RepID=A0ABP0YJ50_9ROSI